MIDKTEIDAFIARNSQQKKKNIFAPYAKDILYMREKNVSLKVILEFLISKDNDIKNRYDNEKKFQTGIAFLSASIKRFDTQIEAHNTDEKVAQDEPEKDTLSTEAEKYLQLGKTMTQFQNNKD